MTIEHELRSVADALAECQRHDLDGQTQRTLTWASMQMHNIARQLRGVAQSLIEVGPATKGTELAQEAVEDLLALRKLGKESGVTRP